VTWPEDVGWRVRAGADLVIRSPLMSDEARAAEIKREEQREAERAELEAEARAEADAERVWELRRQGREPHTVGEFLAQVAAWDAAEQRKLAHRKELGLPVEDDAAPPVQPLPPRLKRWEMEARQKAAKKKAAVTPATQADLSELAGKLGSLKSSVELLKRKPY
jgi:hypothetical protein